MGFNMAANVRERMASSATLWIFDLNLVACRRFVERFHSFGHIEITTSAKELACRSAVVISMVPMDDHVRTVYLNEHLGIIAATPDKNRLFLECSTIDITTTQEIGRKIIKEAVGTYIDAPVSGGVAGAKAGTLSFFCGCTEADEALTRRVKNIVAWMGAPDRINFCGDLGSGLVCKIVNNHIGLSNMVVAAQGMAFGIRHGVDKTKLWQSIKGSSGDSWVMEFAQPVPGIIESSPSSNGFKPGFTTQLCVKDISLGLKAAQEVGIDASMGKAALKIWEKAAKDPHTSVGYHFSVQVERLTYFA